MIDLFRVAQRVQDVCRRQKWDFCFIGGMALQRWGEPRVTQDVDMTLLTGFEGEQEFIRILLTHFKSRVEQAEAFALERRVLLLRSETGIGIDVALGGLPFERLVVRNASDFDFLPGITLRTCSAEDLVVLKAFASRPQDWVDIEGIVARQGPKLKTAYILKQLKPLAEVKEAPEIVDRVRKLFVAEKKRKPVPGRG